MKIVRFAHMKWKFRGPTNSESTNSETQHTFNRKQKHCRRYYAEMQTEQELNYGNSPMLNVPFGVRGYYAQKFNAHLHIMAAVFMSPTK